MGEPNLLKTLCETSSEKRRLNFEPEASRDLYLERNSTLRQGSILLLQVRWVVERPRSYFLPAGRLFEPKKFTKLGAVDGAPSTCCAKHSLVNFFIFLSIAFHAPKTTKGSSEGPLGPPGTFPSLSGSFNGKIKTCFVICNDSSTKHNLLSWARRDS